MDIIKVDGLEHIYAVDTFFPAFKSLFKKNSSTLKKCKLKLFSNLSMLDKLSPGQTFPQQFERLSGSLLFSIRHVGKSNPRVIYAYPIRTGDYLLLVPFVERNRGDYDRAVSQANQMLRSFDL